MINLEIILAGVKHILRKVHCKAMVMRLVELAVS